MFTHQYSQLICFLLLKRTRQCDLPNPSHPNSFKGSLTHTHKKFPHKIKNAKYLNSDPDLSTDLLGREKKDDICWINSYFYLIQLQFEAHLLYV